MAATMKTVLDLLKEWLGDLARPFAIVSNAWALAYAAAAIADKPARTEADAFVLLALGTSLSALYAGKVIENYRIAGSRAEVDKKQLEVATPPIPPPASTDQPAAPPPERE